MRRIIISFLFFIGICSAQDLELISRLTLTNYTPVAIDISENYAFLSMTRTGPVPDTILKVIDIADPYHPRLMAGANGLEANSSIDIEIKNGYAFIADYFGTLQVFDISNPILPQPETIRFSKPHIHKLKIDKNYLYLANCCQGLLTFDISNPGNPMLLSQYNDYFVEAVDASYPYVYYATLTDGISVINMTDPFNPRCICSCEAGYFYTDLKISGQYAYAINGSDLDIFDISDPYNVEHKGTFSRNGRLLTMRIYRNYIFACSMQWIAILDISNPITPEIVTEKRYSQGYDIYFKDGYVYMCACERFEIYALDGVDINEPDFIRPDHISISQNYPNPFNNSTIISYSLPTGSFVKLTVFDLLGRHNTTLINDWQPANDYSIEFKADDLPSGIYFYRLQAGDLTESRKMILIK